MIIGSMSPYDDCGILASMFAWICKRSYGPDVHHYGGARNRRRPGRSPEYNRKAAIRHALLIFWRHGYAGTSLAPLSAAMGMKRPSLKAAFGDKKAGYLLVLQCFRKELGEVVAQFARSTQTTSETLEDLFRSAIDMYSATAQRPGGCPILCSTLDNAGSDPEIRRFLSDGSPGGR